MWDKVKSFLRRVVSHNVFFPMVAVALLVVLLVVSLVSATNSESARLSQQAASATSPAEKVVYAVTVRDPQGIEGVRFAPISEIQEVLNGTSQVSFAALNPNTSVVSIATPSEVLVANYLPSAADALLADLQAAGATVSVNPAGATSGAIAPRGGYPMGYSAAAAGSTATAPEAAESDSLYSPNVPAPARSGGTSFFTIMIVFGVILMMVLFLRRILMNKMQQGGGDRVDKAEGVDTPSTTFADVAGAEEAVEDMEELVDFLRNPDRYASLGAKVPHGALLVGPPGTGKTLLARALAGETGATFIPVSGSDFVEMFVGMGAKRVRNLFAKARKASESGPVIIFIDEIDAVGRKRSTGQTTNANTEQEGTLNALLVELDGFTPRDNIIIIGATNRPDMLDDALLRPGRMERQIHVPLPNRIGREAILRVHLADKPLHHEVNLEVVARRTMGFSGAELASLANEAALICVREGRFLITERDLSHATETVAMGKVRKSAVISERDRLITAWHEAGHAVCGIVQPEGTDVVSISLLPRGQSGGQTWFADGDMAFLTRRAAYARLVTGMGGMAAEQMFFGDGEYTTGPSGDLQQCTNTALAMVTQYGMGEDLLVKDGNVLAAGSAVTDRVFVEAEGLVKQALLDAKQLLADNREFFDRLVVALLDRDTLTASEIEELKAGHELVAPTPPPAPERVRPSAPVGGVRVLDPFAPEPPRRRGRIGRLVGAVASAWREPERRSV